MDDVRLLKRSQLVGAVVSGGMSRLAAVSAELAGSEGIFMGSSRVPPGLRSSPHVHLNCESALYVASGRGRFLVGAHLERALEVEEGDFLYVPPGAPHVVVNDSDADLVLVVARNTQEERVQEYDPDAAETVAVSTRQTPLDRPLLLDRCKSCRVRIRGPLALASRVRGITPYRKNPQLCNRCERRIQGAEEQAVTALFADIRGSTALSVDASGTEFVSILRHFFARATSAVYDHFGMVDRFLGDGMLVFFNAPVPREAHSEDALRAALAIQDGFRDARFGVGIGIETGMALAGDPGLGEIVDFTCLGEPVNIASRLQTLAGPGEIVVGPNAWRSVAELVDLRQIPAIVETHEVKGVGPLEVHRLRPRRPDLSPRGYRSCSSPRMPGAEADEGRP
ncbi:MAG: cupin domain-containing protein [Acidimicrobiales bacterium]